MPDELHTAAAAGDLNTIISLSQATDFDVNILHTQHQTRAIDFAAQGGHLTVLQYLIETLKADVSKEVPGKTNLLYWGLKSKHLNLCRYILSKLSPHLYDIDDVYELLFHSKEDQELISLEKAIIHSNGIDNFIQGDQTLLSRIFVPNILIHNEAKWAQLFKLLLQRNADLNRGSNLPINSLSFANRSSVKCLFFELLIRADYGSYLKVYKFLKVMPTSEEVIDQLGSRKLKKSQLDQIKMMLEKLVQQKLLPDSLSHEIYQALENRMDLSVDPTEYPLCLKEFIASPNKLKLTKEELVLQLQHARDLIPTPYTEAQLQLQKDINFDKVNAHRNAHPLLYTLDNLDEFIHPKNHLKSLLEIRAYPKIVPILCMAIVHPELQENTKNLCLFLLKHRESPTNLEEAILSVSEISFNSAQIMVDHIGELKNETNELKTKVDYLTHQAQETNTKLDLMMSFLKEKESNKNLKRKNLDLANEDNQKKQAFSKTW